jgi:hypothetical protein
MTIAFVLGNGVSRREIDIPSLAGLGKIYGCNALYREYTPEVLVATDKPIAQRIQETGYSARHRFYTRRPIEGFGALKVPHDYFGFSSGPIATAIAAQDGHRHIYLLGFDMGPETNNRFNNLYAGTEFYKAPDATPTYTGNWIKQLTRVVRDHEQTVFFRVQGPTTAHIADFDQLSNLKHQPLNTFLDRINNKKDL